MTEYVENLMNWHREGKDIAMARVIKAKGSSPRPMGSFMFINSDGQMVGSVSGGCVEGEMVKNSRQIFESKESIKIGFGVADEEAWKVGLPCGGAIHTFIQKFDIENEVWKELIVCLKKNEPCAVITSLEEEGCRNVLYRFNTKSSLGDSMVLEDEVWEAYTEKSHKIIESEGVSYFIQIFPQKPRLLAIGAAHITADLITLASNFGFETIVIDPRGFFTKNFVFQTTPDQLINDYPSEVLGDLNIDSYTFCAILSHDPKIDDDAIEYLLNSDAAYIGALGSKRRHLRRIENLMERGYSQEQVNRIYGPIGVAINSITAREIALSIMAQIVEVQNKFRRKNITSN